MALAATDLVQGMNWIWALILLLNPVDAFRISILFGLEAIPMAPGGELESLGFLFDRIGFTALGSFVLWIFLMIVIGGWRLRRQEH